MAIKQLKFVKSSGRSSVGIYQYICRTDEQSQKADRCLAYGSAHLPDFAGGVGLDFWEKADLNERANAKVCSHLILTFAREIGESERAVQLQEFIEEHLDGCPLTWAIHEGHEDHNPHAHIMFSERRIRDDREQGFSEKRFFKRNGVKKDREIHNKKFCSELYRSWASMTNRYLERAGIGVENHLSVEPKRELVEEKGEEVLFQDMGLVEKIEKGVENRLQAEELRMMKAEDLGIEDLAGEIQRIKEKERVENGRRAIGKFNELAEVNRRKAGCTGQEDRGIRVDYYQSTEDIERLSGSIEQGSEGVRKEQERRDLIKSLTEYASLIARRLREFGEKVRRVARARKLEKIKSNVKSWIKDKWIKINTVPDTGRPFWENASKIEHEKKFESLQDSTGELLKLKWELSRGKDAESSLELFCKERDKYLQKCEDLEKEVLKWNKKDPLLERIYEIKIGLEERSKEVVPALNEKVEEHQQELLNIRQRALEASRRMYERQAREEQEKKKKFTFRPKKDQDNDQSRGRGMRF